MIFLNLINAISTPTSVSKFTTIRELFELLIIKRKFYMFPIIILLLAMIGVTSLAQSGLVAFIYPI